MKTRTLGVNGPEVSAMGLGCMGLTFGYGAVDESRAVATVRRAMDAGITFFDSSDHYGPETNEVLLGRAFGARRPDVKIATKFGTYSWEVPARVPDGRPEHVRQALEGSLQRLGTDYVDIYFQHRVDPLVPIEETVGAMAELVQAGKVLYLGLSEASAETIRRAHAEHPIACVQSEYSLWSRDIEVDILPTLRELGIGLTPYSPLGRGFLTGQITSRAELPADDFRQIAPRFEDTNLQHNWALVERVKAVAERHGATSAQIALAWVLERAEHCVPIPGTTRPERIDENLKALDITLTPQDHAELEADFIPAGERWPAAMMRYVAG